MKPTSKRKHYNGLSKHNIQRFSKKIYNLPLKPSSSTTSSKLKMKAVEYASKQIYFSSEDVVNGEMIYERIAKLTKGNKALLKLSLDDAKIRQQAKKKT